MPSKLFQGIVLSLILAILGACSHVRPPGAHTPSVTGFRITGSFETEGLKGRLLMVVKEPDLVRVELYGAMNTLLMAVAGSNSMCTIYRDGRVDVCSWRGSILVEPWELVSVITARYERLTGWKHHRDKEGRIFELVKYRWGRPLLRITIEDHIPVAGRLLPDSVTIRGGNRTLKLRFTHIEPAPSVNTDTFRLGVKTEALRLSRPS